MSAGRPLNCALLMVLLDCLYCCVTWLSISPRHLTAPIRWIAFVNKTPRASEVICKVANRLSKFAQHNILAEVINFAREASDIAIVRVDLALGCVFWQHCKLKSKYLSIQFFNFLRFLCQINKSVKRMPQCVIMCVIRHPKAALCVTIFVDRCENFRVFKLSN